MSKMTPLFRAASVSSLSCPCTKVLECQPVADIHKIASGSSPLARELFLTNIRERICDIEERTIHCCPSQGHSALNQTNENDTDFEDTDADPVTEKSELISHNIVMLYRTTPKLQQSTYNMIESSFPRHWEPGNRTKILENADHGKPWPHSSSTAKMSNLKSSFLRQL